MSKFQDRLIADGYCDSRGVGFCATATELPKGEYGMVALCLNGNILTLYDVDMRSNLGAQLYTVELNRVENLKIKTGLFSQSLKFEFDGGVYAFANLNGLKAALKTIEEEVNKR